MSSNNDYDNYIPPSVSFTKKESVVLVLILIFLYFEIKYMDVWCKWFTNC
jgi:hypothetical protein